MMNDIEKIKKMVRVFARKQMRDVKLVSIDVEPALDKDGDRVFSIRVVFDGKNDQLDSRVTTDLVRALRSGMDQELKEPGFPLLWFVAANEFNETQAAG